MRTHHKIAGTLTATAALTLVLAGTATAAPAGASSPAATTSAIAARSTVVKLNNWTGCTLTREGWSLAHGIWSLEPPVRIADQQQGFWASESNGFATGTEGTVRFFSENCANPVLNGRIVQLHWNNPYVGSNSYDSNGTDLKFYVPKPSGGSGNNAVVEFSAWGR
ncbi:hypothetical protein Kpho02_58000 [Kitasatospora phosalacinea]|uniref:Secreted protein n=1 Tax=Kitasatospora phosalacinea TaxID=2065 RepID=A0A9W6V3B7_9ACTN|nr:aegerolysin family protein [Kitasatospora phosalacinea]GLW73501.1 hypothetical protein Kpho02_58000 [Kitasatospora phosalacinea]